MSMPAGAVVTAAIHFHESIDVNEHACRRGGHDSGFFHDSIDVNEHACRRGGHDSDLFF
jgi:hypothetical protein